MSRLEGTQAAKVIRKRQTPHVIIRFNRSSGSYVDGIFLESADSREEILIYTQPVNKNLDQNDIGERSIQIRNGWATINQLIKLRDRIEINDGEFTVMNIQEWPFHRSFELRRTGEKQNIAEGATSAGL